MNRFKADLESTLTLHRQIIHDYLARCAWVTFILANPNLA